MGIHNNAVVGASGQQGYQIQRSVRLRSSVSASFSRTFTTPTNGIKYTWSGWVKRGALSTEQGVFCQYTSNTDSVELKFLSTGELKCYVAIPGNIDYSRQTTQVFRDPSAWYHVVFVFDSANATSDDRIIFYINGTRVTVFTDPDGTIPQNNVSAINTSARVHYLGYRGVSTNYLDGYLGEINFIDGQALTPSSFGKTDGATGQWIPKKFAGTYGTNGFYLKFADTSAATAAALGKDSSPNGNNWTPNNIDLSSTTTITSFTTTGSSTWIAPVGVTSVNYLVVAGGGAGGSAGPPMYDGGSGGGGAGGFANGSLVVVPGTSYTVTVGTAGTGATGRTRGANGSNSVFSTITAIGGGGGGGALITTGANGGSGGGGGNGGAAGTGTVGQGNNGGYYAGSPGNGGGGAGSVGGSATNNNGAAGGSGLASSISGSSVTYAAGGGGGGYQLSGGAGGSSIGGSGGNNNANGSNATGYGSGGGGSGATYNTTGTLSGGSGSSGIVILSYTSPTSNTYDAMIDSPTIGVLASNYATLNPLVPVTNTTRSNGNLTFTKTGNSDIVLPSTIAMPSGKFYWETTLTTVNNTNNIALGLVQQDAPAAGTGTWPGGSDSALVIFTGGGNLYVNGTSISSTGVTYATNDVIGLALDMSAATLALYKNGSLVYTATSLVVTKPYLALFDSYGSGESQSVNFGQRPFTYTPPSGFKSLNTYNLP